MQPLLDISPGRRLPLWPLHFGWWGVPLEILIFLAPLAVIVAAWRRKRPSVMASTMACLLLDSHFVQRADWIYLLWVGALVIPWTLICLVDLACGVPDSVDSPLGDTPADGWAGNRAVTRTIGAIGIGAGGWYTALSLLIATALSPLSPKSPYSLARDAQLAVRHGSHVIIDTTPAAAGADRSLINYLDARAGPHDTVFIAPRALRYAIWNMTSLYYVLGPRPATPYLEMNPGVETQAAVQRQIISGLAHCRWIVLTREGYWYEPNTSHIPGSALLQHYIWQHYRVVFSNSSFWLLERGGPTVRV